jgi:hypothetical protein
VRRAADAGCWFVQNPRSNSHNRVGYPSALRAPRAVALGTDGFPADLLAERAALLGAAIAKEPDPAVVDQRCLSSFELAWERLGARVELPAAGEDVGAWLSERATAARRHLEVEGRTIVEDGQLVTGDMGRIRAEARAEAERLWARL